MESYQFQQNILFTDPQFPADLSSLYNEKNNIKENSKTYMKSLKWKRASVVLGKIGIENEHIQPNDIKQGSIGNCYFLSALSSLAQYPERVLNMFENLEEFYIQGEPKLITIDDFIPVRSNNLPAFCHSQRNKVWPIILEKAWAKLHNGYQNSSSGHTDVALSYLTGASCKYVDNVKLGNNLWQTLLDSDKKLHIIASSVSMDKEEFKEIFKDNGLSNNHAYSVIKLQTAQLFKDGKEERLINLRNPWGKCEFNEQIFHKFKQKLKFMEKLKYLSQYSIFNILCFNGDWNKNDQRWTDDLKKKLAYEYQKPGEFWMSIFDFSTQFRHSQICMVNDFFQRNIVKLQAKKGQFYAFEFTVRQELDIEELHLIAYQMDKKIGKIKYGAFKYSEVQMQIGRKETSQNIMSQFPIDYVASRKAQKYETVISNFEKLIPGTYVLLLQVDWIQSFTQDMVVAAYSAQDIQLTQVQYDHSMLEKMLKSCAYKYSETRKYFENQGFQDSFYCFDMKCSRINYGIIYVQNNSSRNFTYEIDFRTFGSCKILSSLFKHGDKLNLKVNAYNNNCIIIGQNKHSGKIKFNYRLIFKRSQKFHRLLAEEDNNELLTQVLTFGRLQQQNFHGRIIGVYLQDLCYKNGYLIYVENQTNSKVLYIADFQFTIQNLKIIDAELNIEIKDPNINLVLVPGTSKFLKFFIQNNQF